MKKQILSVLFITSICSMSFSQVGIGTTTPNNLAVLDLTSTTQGFLLPRLTYDQRLNMPTPIATGLIIWCSDCGQNGQIQVFNGQIWTNIAGGLASVPPPAVGDYRYGGVVFWVDPLDNTHGLICAIEDQSDDIQWYNGTYIATNAHGVSIGTGKANTELIIAAQGPTETNYAAGLARAYRGGGYSDWFLPSKDELNEIFKRIESINNTAIAHGGTAMESQYWSSSENEDWSAWMQGRSLVLQHPKSSRYRIRAIRAF